MKYKLITGAAAEIERLVQAWADTREEGGRLRQLVSQELTSTYDPDAKQVMVTLMICYLVAKSPNGVAVAKLVH